MVTNAALRSSRTVDQTDQPQYPPMEISMLQYHRYYKNPGSAMHNVVGVHRMVSLGGNDENHDIER